MKISIVTGSRADYGLLEWPIKVLSEDDYFQGQILKIWGHTVDSAFQYITQQLTAERPDVMMALGDRYEILGAVIAAHLLRVPVAHIGGGDVTEGSYDDAMRDAISRMATIHFVTSTSAMARLSAAGYRNVHLVGNPGVDYIRHAPWRELGPPAIAKPYVVVAYYPETIDGTVAWGDVQQVIGMRKPVFILPNPDSGSDQIAWSIANTYANADCRDSVPHAEFLNLVAHCEELIGNSSCLLYEAPELGIKTRMIGKRQRGRTIPFGDGNASLRIANLLKRTAL